ncbi:MAG: type II toxin-antitoxin system PemK/MazF family toxin [Dehalococcoidia bacterium]
MDDPPDDPKRSRLFVVANQNRFLETPYSTATCIPVYSSIHGLPTELILNESNGLKLPSAARCDELHRILRKDLYLYIGSLSDAQLVELSRALAIALEIRPEDISDL